MRLFHMESLAPAPQFTQPKPQIPRERASCYFASHKLGHPCFTHHAWGSWTFKQYCLNVAQRINKFGQLCNRTSWQWRRSGGEGKEEAWQKNKAMLVLYPIRNVWDTIRKNYIQIILILLTSPSLEKQRIKSSGGSRGMLLQPSSSWLYRPRPPSTSSGACPCQNEVYSTFQHKLSFGLTAHPSVCIRTRENIDVAFGDSVGWVNIADRCNFFKLTRAEVSSQLEKLLSSFFWERYLFENLKYRGTNLYVKLQTTEWVFSYSPPPTPVY